MPSLKRITLNNEEYHAVVAELSDRTSNVKTLNDTYILTSINGNLYRIKNKNSYWLIYKQIGNVHTYHRTSPNKGPTLRDSTIWASLHNQICIDKLPTVNFPKYEQNDVKQKHYLVPFAPLIKKRPITQAQAMGGESAHAHILRFPHTFTTPSEPHEWLHLQAFSQGGGQHESNLVAGSKDSNSLQIGIEDALIFCQGALNSAIGNIIINVTISSATIPGTNIGTLGTYLIKLTDQSNASHIDCPPIYLNMNYHASKYDRALRPNQVRVVFTKVCEMIIEQANQLLGMRDLIDASSMIDISANQLFDEQNDEAADEYSEQHSMSDSPTVSGLNNYSAGTSMSDEDN